MIIVRYTILFLSVCFAAAAQGQINVKPVILGQLPVRTNKNVPITIKFSDLIVVDADDIYPNGFTLKLYAGKDFTFQGATVTPKENFTGTLTVPVTVNDGQDVSNKFNLRVVVLNVNTPPVITGQDKLSTNEDQPITIKLNDLNVTDPDDDYPKGFTLKIPQGNGINYKVSGTTVTPVKDFNGEIVVKGVVVNDGNDNSNPYDIKITVNAINDPPVITGQQALSTYVNTPITVQLSNLLVTDPDTPYPQGFTLKISAGVNYQVAGNVITPARNFQGTLKANVTVNDGQANSNTFELQIKVIPPENIAPVITGQTGAIVITEYKPPAPPNPLTILPSHLQVTDPDNPNYPTGFTLSVLPGPNYTVSGLSITPAPNFTGTISVGVTVNDGKATSNVFGLQVTVIPISVTPQIVGQKPLMIDEDQSIAITLNDLYVTDADDNYPQLFTLQIFPDPEKQYTVNGNTVIPNKNLNGFLTVLVRVKDKDNNPSNVFNLSVLINAVNDAPEITEVETTAIVYVPGTGPVVMTSTFKVEDVDNDNLSFATISIDTGYQQGYDELLFTNTTNIRGIFDSNTGELSLFGFAPLAEYQEAVRSVMYTYQTVEDEQGNGSDIPPGRKTIALQVRDGQLASATKTRTIIMETTASLDIPTAFSPNGDGANETWNIKALSNPDRCEDAIIKVYNKRGQLLFHAIGLEKKWDGTFNGVVLPTDTYYFTIDLSLSYNNVTYNGVVTILR